MTRLFEIGTYSKFWWKMKYFIDHWIITVCITLHKISRTTGFLWPAFSRIRVESKIILGNTRQRKPVFWHILCSVNNIKNSFFVILGFWNGVLLLATGASAVLVIYKQELGCKDETPQLQKNVNKINRKQAELVEMKDDINLRWIPAKYLFILAWTKNWMQVIK